MLALYISYSIGLSNPFWAMMTAYVVTTQPWAGSIRSKALYRLAGTVLGSGAAIAIIPNLNQSPLLTTVAMSLWVGGCLYISLLDRTPRSYVFMLAGYTAALIGFPAVDDPIGLFDKGISRVEEISLGIMCAALVHTLVLPRSIAPVVMSGLDQTLAHARSWIVSTLRCAAPEEDRQNRRKLANDITQPDRDAYSVRHQQYPLVLTPVARTAEPNHQPDADYFFCGRQDQCLAISQPAIVWDHAGGHERHQRLGRVG